jgi:CRP/FNR family cyclic AMP-dependent transcriptional regulator
MTDIHIFKSSPDAVEVAAGEILFSEGEAGDEMFAVVEGEVELTHQGRVIESVTAGGILGEMALIDTAPRSATATAQTSTRIVRIDQKRFTFLVHEHPTFALQVMRVMARRLRQANVTADR